MGFQEEEMPGQQPDPEFKAWFATEWKRLHEAVQVPGMKYASWDRKAAYLLYRLGQLYDTELYDCTWLEALESALDLGSTLPLGDDAYKSNPADPALLKPTVPGPSVGNGPAQRAQMVDDRWPPVNPDEDAACPPSPGGVPLDFDSAKW